MSVISAEHPRRCFGHSSRDRFPSTIERPPDDREFPGFPATTSRSTFAGGPHVEITPNLRQGGHTSRWPEQYAEIVGPRRGRLHRLARRILRSEDLADDAVQEALLSLW